LVKFKDDMGFQRNELILELTFFQHLPFLVLLACTTFMMAIAPVVCIASKGMEAIQQEGAMEKQVW
jgi:hypothetical protein